MQADWPDGTLPEYILLPASSVVLADGLEDMDVAQLAAVSCFVVPYGGLVRGRLAAGETLVVNGATGAYGSAAVLVALAMGAGRVVATGPDGKHDRRSACLVYAVDAHPAESALLKRWESMSNSSYPTEQFNRKP